jgi:microcin C transport system substrate-binding protein
VKPEGGDNLAGVCSPVVDALVDAVITATNRAELGAAVQALDRVLLAGWYMVPHWHLRTARAAWWDRYARPEKPVRPGLALDTWWFDATRAAATDAARRAR